MSALREEWAFPAADLWPVDFLAFRRLARRCLSETTLGTMETTRVARTPRYRTWGVIGGGISRQLSAISFWPSAIIHQPARVIESRAHPGAPGRATRPKRKCRLSGPASIAALRGETPTGRIGPRGDWASNPPSARKDARDWRRKSRMSAFPFPFSFLFLVCADVSGVIYFGAWVA